MMPSSVSVDRYYEEILVCDGKIIMLDYAPRYDNLSESVEDKSLLSHLQAIKNYSKHHQKFGQICETSTLILKYATQLNYSGTMSTYLTCVCQAITNNWDSTEISDWNEMYRGQIHVVYRVLGDIHKSLNCDLQEFHGERDVYFIHLYMKLACVLAKREGYPRLYYLLLPFTRKVGDITSLITLNAKIDVTPRNHVFMLGHDEVTLEKTLEWIEIVQRNLRITSTMYKRIRFVEHILRGIQDITESFHHFLLQTCIYVEKVITRSKRSHECSEAKANEV